MRCIRNIDGTSQDGIKQLDNLWIPTKYPWCDTGDIKIKWGDSKEYTIASCNVWATKAWTWSSSYWDYFTFRNAKCAQWYHVPSQQEWFQATGAWMGWDNNWLYHQKRLNLPFAGGWNNNKSTAGVIGKDWFYWSSDIYPYDWWSAYALHLYSWPVGPGRTSFKKFDSELPVRCFRD